MKTTGIYLTVIGGIAGIWGLWYTSSHRLEALGAMFGAASGTYTFASIAGPLGILVAIIGVILWAVGAKREKGARPGEGA